MNSSTFLGITTFLYLFIMVLNLYYIFFKNKKLELFLPIVIVIGLLFHTTGL